MTQDENQKEKNHSLMSTISKAKKENDLITLLNLYAQYFKKKNFI